MSTKLKQRLFAVNFVAFVLFMIACIWSPVVFHPSNETNDALVNMGCLWVLALLAHGAWAWWE